MSGVDLSVCIVNWNSRDLLRQCLDSIQRADTAGLTVETIVVDNGSSDGSAEMVAREFPQVVLVQNADNTGFARANNQAADVARGRWLLFLNNDTIVGRQSLGQMVEFMRRNPNVGMAGPRLLGADGRPQISYRTRPTLAALMHRIPLVRWTGLFRRAYQRYRRRTFDPAMSGPVETLMGAAVCLPREVFFEHGGWDDGFAFGAEDLDLSARVGQTHQVVFFPGADIVHLGSVSSRANSGFVYTGMECGYVRYLRKQGSRPWTLLLYKLLFTLSLPLALLLHAIGAARHRVRPGRSSAGKASGQLRAVWHFSTRGLGSFWRA
jgi:N-acetylglucosaminyl-diphospho-decaprenol L-rhamnosyltransferase